MKQSTQVSNVSEQFIEFIVHLFKRQTSSILIILGRRGTGKTDLALLLAQILHEKGIIKNVSTNIKIYDSPFEIAHVSTLDDLKGWASSSKDKKLFIFDEIGKAMKRRRPMGSLTVALIDNFHVLRKYKLSTIATTISAKYVDTTILGSDMLDGYFKKPYFSNRKIAHYVDYLENFDKRIVGIPATSVDFDTWDSSPFKQHGKKRKPHFKKEDENLLWDWTQGKTQADLGVHRQKFKRILKKFIRSHLEHKRHTSQ